MTPKERLTSRVSNIRSSATLAISSLAARLKKEGRDVISFGAGEPDLETPAPVRAAGIEAIRTGQGRYTAAAGLPDLRRAVARKVSRQGRPTDLEEVVCCSGAKSALFLSLYVLLERGDEVLFPSPHWSSYEDMARAAGGCPKPVPASAVDGFQVKGEILEAAITSKTRVLLLNSPNNPTGCLYTESTLRDLAEVARRHDLAILSDDIYESLIYTGEPFRNVLSVAPDLSDQTILVSGFSKSHSMTGWRLGYLTAPRPIAAAAARLQSQVAGNPCAISQIGGIAGLEHALDPSRLAIFDRRRRLMLEEIARLPRVSCPEPQGAFYCFPDFSSYLGSSQAGQLIETDHDLAQLLLDQENVALIPGSIFGAPGHLRLTYACSEESIRAGVRRVARCLASLAS